MALILSLLRHAQHERGPGVLCGRLAGIGLSSAGVGQARSLASRFGREPVDALYTSPAERCRQTADIIGEACGLTPAVLDAAAEVDFGEWSGKAFSALDADPKWRAWNGSRAEAQAPGGEAMRDVSHRVVLLMEKLRSGHGAGSILLVSHAEIIRTTILLTLGLPLQAYERIEIDLASISVVSLQEGGGRVLGLNDVGHLAAIRSVEVA